MHRQPFLLAAASLGLITAAVVVAAVLLLDNGDGGSSGNDATPDTAAALSSTPTQAPSPAATAGPPPDGVPDDVWARLETLPDRLRDDLTQRFESGAMGIPEIENVIDEYERRDQSVRVGTVLEATDALLRLEVYTTGERAEVQLNDETVLRRGNDDIRAADLEPAELVLVISRDGGATAFAVTAFGVGAP